MKVLTLTNEKIWPMLKFSFFLMKRTLKTDLDLADDLELATNTNGLSQGILMLNMKD